MLGTYLNSGRIYADVEGVTEGVDGKEAFRTEMLWNG